MATVKVNGTVNGLVHKGGNWFSAATLPDVCKTPTPGGPVPMPYPNLSQASTLTDGSVTVKADGGNMIAIKGSRFAISTGDEPGTVGGIKSNTFKQASTWLLYSFDVKIEGKNACRFSDKKFQNNENTIDAAGTMPIVVNVALVRVKMACGELGQYGAQKRVRKGGRRARDHVPSKAALKERAKKLKKRRLNACERKMIDNNAFTIVIPTGVHRRVSRTYAQKATLAKADANDLQQAAKDDTRKIKKHLKGKSDSCYKAYAAAAMRITAITNRDYDRWLKRIIKNCRSRR